MASFFSSRFENESNMTSLFSACKNCFGLLKKRCQSSISFTQFFNSQEINGIIICVHIHYFQHKQQELVIEKDDPMSELASSKWFCITTGRTPISKHRRSFSNPFESSVYLLKQIKQQAASRRNNKNRLKQQL